MITVTIMKEKFKNRGRGNSPRESLMGGNFPGGSFPDTTFNKLWINSQNK